MDIKLTVETILPSTEHARAEEHTRDHTCAEYARTGANITSSRVRLRQLPLKQPALHRIVFE